VKMAENNPQVNIKAKFKKETVRQVSKIHFQSDKTKYNNDSLLLTTEMLRIYVLEAAHRAAHQAKSEGAQTVQLEHLEKVLPQFLMDFV